MLKCFDSEKPFDGEAAVRALRAAVDDYGADVVSMRWIVNEEDAALGEAVKYAAEKGAVLVASALDLGEPGYDTVLGWGYVNKR